VVRRILWIIGLLVLGSLLARRVAPKIVAMLTGDCDPSYPTLCIPVGAPDLDCAV